MLIEAPFINNSAMYCDLIANLHDNLERQVGRKVRLHQTIPIKGNDLSIWRGFH
jgi:hypothetical protein